MLNCLLSVTNKLAGSAFYEGVFDCQWIADFTQYVCAIHFYACLSIVLLA